MSAEDIINRPLEDWELYSTYRLTCTNSECGFSELIEFSVQPAMESCSKCGKPASYERVESDVRYAMIRQAVLYYWDIGEQVPFEDSWGRPGIKYLKWRRLIDEIDAAEKHQKIEQDITDYVMNLGELKK